MAKKIIKEKILVDMRKGMLWKKIEEKYHAKSDMYKAFGHPQIEKAS